MIDEQIVERAKRRVLYMVELEIEAIYVRSSNGKCSNAVVVLLKESKFEDPSIEWLIQLTVGSTPNS